MRETRKKAKRFINMELGITDDDLKDVVSVTKVDYLGEERFYESKQTILKFNPTFDLVLSNGELIRAVHYSFNKIPQKVWMQQPNRDLRNQTAKESLQFALKARSKVLSRLK
jgi:hypothetical protein